jgi:hypothetical protein
LNPTRQSATRTWTKSEEHSGTIAVNQNPTRNKSDPPDRHERLALELRANLKKRRELARARRRPDAKALSDASADGDEGN